MFNLLVKSDIFLLSASLAMIVLTVDDKQEFSLDSENAEWFLFMQKESPDSRIMYMEN